MIDLKKLLNVIKKCKGCIYRDAIGQLKRLTAGLASGKVPLTDATEEKLGKIAKGIIKRQRPRNSVVKHGGFWEECDYNFKRYNFEKSYAGIIDRDMASSVIRYPTIIISNFLATYFVLSTKKEDYVKESINKALRFDGMQYLGYVVYNGQSNVTCIRDSLLDRFLNGLTPQYVATYYKEDERLLPILSYFVRLYKSCKLKADIFFFLRDGKFPSYLSSLESLLKNNEEANRFYLTLRKDFLPSYDEDSNFTCDEYGLMSLPYDNKYELCGCIFPILSKQFERASFNPDSFKEPNFSEEKEKWLAAD